MNDIFNTLLGRAGSRPLPAPAQPPAEDDLDAIGRVLRQERERLGLRHADIQARVGLDASFLSKFENDSAGANPSLSSIRRYAEALNKKVVCRLEDLSPTQQRVGVELEDGTNARPAFDRRVAVDRFLEYLGTQGVTSYHMAYADLARTRADEVAREYFPRLKTFSDADVEHILGTLRTSIEANGDHGMIDDWKMTVRGVADYLLRPGDLDGLHRLVAAECVIRLSGYSNHGVELYARFRPAAQAVGDLIWGRYGIKLPYIKIPEPWTATVPSTDHEGYVTVWDFAGQQRALASRILCFLCDTDFRNVYLPADEHALVGEEYRNNRDVLMRWAVTSDHVDRITRVLIVHKQGLINYLSRRGFNQSQTYKPSAGVRDRWFKTWKHELPDSPPEA